MRVSHIAHLMILLSANIALALPMANLNKAVQPTQDANCSRSGYSENYRDLIHKASVIGDDDRKSMSRTLVRMSSAQAEQAMRCTGQIHCPGLVNGKAHTFSAGAICAPGSRGADGNCSPDRLATAAHGFIDSQKVQLINNLAKCEFRNYRGFSTTLQISDVKNSINPSEVYDPSVSAADRKPMVRADKAVVRLKNPIPGCDPYDIAKPDQLPVRGDDLVAITSMHEDLTPAQANPNEPLVYGCSATRTFSPRAGRSGAFYSDCDVNGGGSGGFTLVRDSNGKFILAGIFSGSGVRSQDGFKYNESINQHTASVAVNADFIQMAMDPGSRPVIQTGQGETPTVPVARPTSN